VLAKGMATRRDDRYPSAVEFARALQRVELELGYAATTIEVPNLASAREAAPDDDADATRARAVRSVEAQPIGGAPAPRDDDATRARTPRSIDAQPAAPRAARAATPDEGTVLRSAALASVDTHDALVDQTVARARAAASVADPVDATQVRPRRAGGAGGAPVPDVASEPTPKRSRLGAILGISAAIVVVSAIGIAVALSGTLRQDTPDPTTAPGGEDAVVAATVPTPVVEPGVRSADGSTVSFSVSHENAEEADRYRWQRADGSGATEVTDTPVIVVAGVAAGERICIDVQVQRGSKTSETAQGCTP
jgi:eukaryotic-like serine/threonine-protein kinase